MVAAMKDSVHAIVSQLLRHINTAVTKDTPGHVQFDIRTDVNFLKSTTLKFVARTFRTMFKSQILKMAFACLVADRAIQWVIEQ